MSFKLLLLSTLIVSSTMAYECKLVDQSNYDGIHKTMFLEITSDKVTTAIKDNIMSYKVSKIKNVYLSSSPFAFDVLQIDKNMVYMNHYSDGGRAYQTWKCRK